MPKYVIGAEQMVMNLNRVRIKWLGKIADAVEKSCVDGSNHAKSGHAGIVSHANHRFMSQTENLVNSIEPKMFKISVNEVIGGIVAGEDYAPFLEFGTSNMWFSYPFLFPALVHIQPILRVRLELAMRGI